MKIFGSGTRLGKPGNAWRTAGMCLAVLLAAVAGVMFLRVTLLASLGGDDCINNLTTYYRVMTEPFGDLLQEGLAGIWNALTFGAGRFFPFYLPFGEFTWLFQGTIDSYRLYIIGYTLVVAALLGIQVWMLTQSRAAGGAVLAAMPLMFCLWYDVSINGMYSYGALPQAALLAALLASICMTRWARTRHIRWAVGAALFTFIACGTYEIGYTYIVMLGLVALYLHDRFRESFKTLLPACIGEAAALFFYIGNSLAASAAGGGYDGVQPAFDLSALLLVWVQQMSAGFPLNPILFSGASLGTPTGGDVFWSLILAVLAVGALFLVRRSLSKKQGVLLLLMGLSMLALPALLVALSSKYQTNGWVSWSGGYIPAVVESFGVGLLFITLTLLLFQWLRRHTRWGAVAAAVVLVVGLTACGVCQRSVTRLKYEGLREEPDRMAACTSSGMLDEVPEYANVVTTWDVWGHNDGAVEAAIRRYAGREVNGWDRRYWNPENVDLSLPIYMYESYVNYGGYDLVWLGKAQDADLALVDGLKVYVEGNVVPDTAVLKYKRMDDNGEIEECAVKLLDLKQSERNDNNSYFVWVDDENIVAEKIMIWAG